MKDPVVILTRMSAYSYERKAIEKRLREKHREPKTLHRLLHPHDYSLVGNQTLKTAIVPWIAKLAAAAAVTPSCGLYPLCRRLKTSDPRVNFTYLIDAIEAE